VRESNPARPVTLFTRDGRTLGTLPMNRPPVVVDVADGLEVRLVPWSLRPDGTFRSIAVPHLPPATVSRWTAADTVLAPVLRFSMAATPLDTIGWDEVFVETSRARDPIQVRVGLVTAAVSIDVGFDTPLRLPMPAGGQLGVRRALPESPSNGEVIVTLLAPSRDTLWSRSYGYRPRPFGGYQADSLAHQLGLGLRRQGADSAAVAGAIQRLPEFPAFFPPVTRIVATAAGEIWLQREPDGSPLTRWTVLDPDGAPLGQLRLPGSVIMRIVGRDQVWIVEPDRYGVPWLVRYDILRPTPS
jgi:hypothetical protein